MNPSGRKKLLGGLILVLCCAMVGLGLYLFKGQAPIPKLTVEDVHVDSDAAMKLNLLQQVSKKNGITEWELDAASATLVSEENKAILEQVKVVFYTKEEKKVHLRADKGELDTETHDMFFSSNVVVEHEGYTLKTDKLHYKKKPHIIQSDAPIRLENKDSEVEADEMIMDLRANRIVLNRNVKGIFSENFKLP
ncbi:MAG: LPS export ABC transporter periplasmic protein LptC [Desulfobacterales bacterium]|nr:LPS export ABC transporter periplasmic protein LptC [Desulfobacterales bacterium]